MSLRPRRRSFLPSAAAALVLAAAACDREAPTEVSMREIASSGWGESLSITTDQELSYVACMVTPGAGQSFASPDVGNTFVGLNKAGEPYAIVTVATGKSTAGFPECSSTVFEQLLGAYCKAGYEEPLLQYGVQFVSGPDPDTSILLSKDVLSCPATNSVPAVTRIVLPPEPIQLGWSATVSAEFEDLDAEDSHVGGIEWGDGDASPVTLVAGDRHFTRSHTYEAAGVYTVSATVTDAADAGDRRSSDLDVPAYIVVYDPSGGFVTGGGWIHSTAGAYVADPALSGKATFGFVSKYKKGASVPGGNTQFKFQAAGFEFRSTSYQWLVITGARARYKGTGTVNGAGNYGFMLTAIDGNVDGGGGVDRFRLKVWEASGESVVYDNELTAADDADPTSVLGGGSIVIHKAK